MKILIDVCIPPSWVDIFSEAGYEATHWSQIGNRSAADEEIFEWAGDNMDT